MSRVFDFVERWVAETEQKRRSRGESGKKIPESRRRERGGETF